jgi:murein DD-endopeptidase MepM/ murein hydrolase activator NlpD
MTLFHRATLFRRRLPPLFERGVPALFAAVAATLALLLVAGTAAADPHDDQARVDEEMAKTRAALETSTEKAEAAAVAYEEANRLLPDVQRKLAETRGVLAAAQAAARTAARDADQAATEFAGSERVLEVAQAQVHRTGDDIGTYSAKAYQGGDIAGVQALLSVDSPADFVAGLTYLEQVAAVERAMLDRHTRAEAVASDDRRVHASRKRLADRAQRTSDDSVQAAIAAEAEAARAEQEVSDLVAQREQALRVAEEERGANQARMVELQAEGDRIAAELRGIAGGGGAQQLPAGIQLPMPVNGWKSSDFGMRFDPFYKVWQLHAGVDFAAPAGSPVRAAGPARWSAPGGTEGMATTRACTTGRTRARALPPATPTSPRSWPGSASRYARAKSSAGSVRRVRRRATICILKYGWTVRRSIRCPGCLAVCVDGVSRGLAVLTASPGRWPC